MNPFMVFAQQERPLLKRLNPTVPNSGISCLIGQAWHALSQTERLVYVAKSVQIKEEHQLQFPTYKYVPSKRRQQAHDLNKLKLSPAQPSQRKNLKTTVLLHTVRNKLNLHIQVSAAPQKVSPKLSALTNATGSEAAEDNDDDVDMPFPVLTNEFMTAAFSKANMLNQMEIFFEQAEQLADTAALAKAADEDDVYIYEHKSCDLVSPVDTNEGVIFLWTTDMQNVLTQPVANKRLSGGEGVADFFSHDFDF